jgi:hypothetical protein
MPHGATVVTAHDTSIFLSHADRLAIRLASEIVPDLDCRAALRGILKRADLAHRRGELGDQYLPNVARMSDIADRIRRAGSPVQRSCPLP